MLDNQKGRCPPIMADEVTHKRVQDIGVDSDFTLHAIAMTAPLRGGNRVRYKA
jgi:hypothetical protein